MASCSEGCEHSLDIPASTQLGAGDYVGRVARNAALPHCHVSMVVHAMPREVPPHAHDWPFLSTLLRGSYRSFTRTREMEFKHGAAVYHPPAFQHRDEIGRGGGIFLGVQFSPAYLSDTDRAGGVYGEDVVRLQDNQAYVVLGALYAALRCEADQLRLESLTAELASCLFAPDPLKASAAPAWIERAVQRLCEERQVSLSELSRDAGVHATTLTRQFRHHKDCSIGEFHARARMRRAFFAVSGTNAPLAEICHDAGFADQSHMTRAFSRAFAATPGQIRRASLTD
jgi:AraC-like DNA-binding protein